MTKSMDKSKHFSAHLVGGGQQKHKADRLSLEIYF
jgi:hypothetical protein